MSAAVAVQRRRLLKATTAAVAAVGYEGVDLGLILRSAGVSESRFGRNFVSKDDCCRCAFEEVCDHFDRYMTAVYVRRAPARVKVSAAAYAAARYCRDFEQQVRFGVQVHARYGNSRRARDSLRLHLAQVDVLRREVQTSRRVAKVAPELCVGSFLGHGQIGCFRTAIGTRALDPFAPQLRLWRLLRDCSGERDPVGTRPL